MWAWAALRPHRWPQHRIRRLVGNVNTGTPGKKVNYNFLVSPIGIMRGRDSEGENSLE